MYHKIILASEKQNAISEMYITYIYKLFQYFPLYYRNQKIEKFFAHRTLFK